MRLARLTPLVVALAAATSAAAQLPTVHPDSGSVWYQGVSTWRRYVVRGPDTTYATDTIARVDRLEWVGASRRTVVVHTTTLDALRALTVDTLALAPDGALTPLEPDADPIADRTPLLARVPLPSGALDTGATWGDRIDDRALPEGTSRLTEQVAAYTLSSEPDSLGRRALVVHVVGIAHLQESRPDAPRGPVALDARGTFQETWWLDPARGQLLARRRVLHLDGLAVTDADGQIDTLPGGVFADDSWGLISAARAAVLTRPLPGTDSATSLAPVATALHTSRRSGDLLESGLATADGRVATATGETHAGQVRSYRVLWTAPGIPDLALSVTVGRRTVTLAGDTTRSWPRPEGRWAVADVGMEEQLAPVLAAIPDDRRELTLPVLRPRTARWDTLSVTWRALGMGARLFVLSQGPAESRVALLVDSTGALLTVERASTPPARRVPPVGSPARLRLDAILGPDSASH